MLAWLLRTLFNTLLIITGAVLALMGLLGLFSGGGSSSGEAIQAQPVTGISGSQQPAGAAPPIVSLLQETPPVPVDTAVPGSPVELPKRLVIPKIELDAPIAPATESSIDISGQSFYYWKAPDGFQVGWHGDSARLGQPGNVVLNGHHNVYGQVFARLVDLEAGDEIQVYGETQEFRYRIVQIELLPEKDQPVEVRLENGRWILPTSEERLTLVTCWPYDTNTHRLIIVAEPD